MKQGDFCYSCKSPLVKIENQGKIKFLLTCVNEKCSRFGLLTVVGLKMVKKMTKNDSIKRSPDKKIQS
jgi:hypothetical protein